jgi:predicted flap endonuclease-1-like 5' DNA nuclease
MWQTALLLLGAYFIGAWLACMVRRLIFTETEATIPAKVPAATAAKPVPAPAPKPIPPAPAPVPESVPRPVPSAGSEAAARFGRALAGEGDQQAPRPAATGSGMTLPTPPDRSGSGVSTMVEAMRGRASDTGEGAALAAAAAAVSRASPPPPGAPAILPAAAGSDGRTSVAAPVVRAPAPPPATPGDDLTRIQGINKAIEARLNSAGVRRYSEIAAWKPDQVAAIAAVLGMPGRIERENWIEQAQILAKGGETLFSQRHDRGEVAAAEPTPDEGEAKVIASPLPKAEPPAAEAGTRDSAASLTSLPRARVVAPGQELRPAGAVRDNLQRIGGINGEVERLLNVQGVQRYNQIANWTPDDIAKFDRLLGSGSRIARENWVEQAQVLDRGGQTAYSREIDRRMGLGTRAPRAPEAPIVRPQPIEPDGDRTARGDLAVLRSVKSEAYRPADGSPSAASRGYEDLKRIRGIGVLIEKKLNSLGVTRYDQIASWTKDDIERFSDKLDFKGRIERENWVEQARILSAGGQTEFSRRVDRGEVETSKKAE